MKTLLIILLFMTLPKIVSEVEYREPYYIVWSMTYHDDIMIDAVKDSTVNFFEVKNIIKRQENKLLEEWKKFFLKER